MRFLGIDLVDAQFLRGYEWRMMTPAEDTVSLNHITTHKKGLNHY